MIWLPVLGIFNVRTDVDAYDCTRGLCGHRQRVCAGSGLREKNPLPHRGLEPASVHTNPTKNPHKYFNPFTANEPVEQVSAIYPPQRLLTRLLAQKTTTTTTTKQTNNQTKQTTTTNKQNSSVSIFDRYHPKSSGLLTQTNILNSFSDKFPLKLNLGHLILIANDLDSLKHRT